MGKPVEEKKRKKKGRPSLLDLQKRTLRLQKQKEQGEQQEQNDRRNPNPSPNPYLRFPNSSSTPQRRSTRRNPKPEADGDENAEHDEDEEEEEGSSGKRREKKLKLVLRLQGNEGTNAAGSNQDSSGSDSNAGGATPLRKMKIDAVGVGDGSGWEKDQKTERRNSASKATDPLQDLGPTTPLPDKKLLEFILDRLQKKDTYGVYSEPVDPEELPDYHEVIENPMDFGTVRKRLSSGFYANLEQFEKDVFLICSNAMRYNAPDTIYFRQARSIQELAKKDFENLRQESDDNEPEPKVARRGRPPNKSIIKRPVGRPPAERASSDFSSDVTLANTGEGTLWSTSFHDQLRKGTASDKPGVGDVPTQADYGFRNSENSSWMAEHKPEMSEDYLGSARGVATRFGKKISVLDENRRNTFKQPQPSTCGREPSVLTTFDGEKKQLIPIGLPVEHAYARSLARFAANLGPIGWEIAGKQIEKVLPPGTKFGRGWVGEQDTQQPSLFSTSPSHPSSQLKTSLSTVTIKNDTTPERLDPLLSNKAVEEGHLSRCLPPPASSSAVSNRSSMGTMEGTELTSGSNHESSFTLLRGNSGSSMHLNSPPFHLHQNMAIHRGINGFNPTPGLNWSQVGKMIKPSKPAANFASDVVMTHGGALNMVSRVNNSFIHPTPATHLDVERPSNSSTINSVSTLPDSTQGPQGTWRGFSLHQRPESAPPDLNVRFQSPGSPVSGDVIVDSQQPELELQL